MFGDSILKNLTFSRTKLSYLITVALGQYCRKISIEECQGKWYTLIYEETTKTEGKKKL